MKPHLSIRHLKLTYPGQKTPALKEINLDLAPGEILALIGGSGSGKSSLLRSIAGLEKPDTGIITMRDIHLFGNGHNLSPEKRKVGMVSQTGDLFPHLTVLKNICFALRKHPRANRTKQAMKALRMVELENMADRYPAELSGGEAQRVALARAIAYEPELILLDEPFSNLDAIIRDQLRSQTLDLLKAQKITTIFVTHHGDDALAGGDRIAVLRSGKLVQNGSPEEIWNQPADEGVAKLFGEMNFIRHEANQPAICYRPEELHLCAPDCTNCFAQGQVQRVDFRGSCKLVMVELSEDRGNIRIKVPSNSEILTAGTVGIRKAPSLIENTSHSY